MCEHRSPTMRAGRNEDRPKLAGSEATNAAQLLLAHRTGCGKCGAVKVDAQLGLEPTPEEYVEKMVAVFGEVRRVLREDGTLWLNLGDGYASAWPAPNTRRNIIDNPMSGGKRGPQRQSKLSGSLKEKDLIGMPWHVAFALQADGWWLRSDIIWAKPNPMPESVTDRPTRSHEYLFLLSKSARYAYDAAAIAEPLADASVARLAQDVEQQEGSPRANGGTKTNGPMRAVGGRSRPQYRRAIELAEQKGLTEEHLKAIRAVGIADVGKALVTTRGAGRNTERMKILAGEAKVALGGYYREFLTAQTRNARTVWEIGTQAYKEAHFATFPEELARRCIVAGSRPGDTVLDPFGGSGTVAQVATGNGRDSIYIDLNPKYLELARQRIGPMFCDMVEAL